MGGKSTLLHMLKENRAVALPPTVHPNMEELIMGRIRFRTLDLGGHETARRIWRDYYASVDGIIFVVDAADRTRFQEVQEELHPFARRSMPRRRTYCRAGQQD